MGSTAALRSGRQEIDKCDVGIEEVGE